MTRDMLRKKEIGIEKKQDFSEKVVNKLSYDNIIYWI